MAASCTPNGETIVINGNTDAAQYYSYENGDRYVAGAFAQTTEEIDSVSINWLTGSVDILGEDRAGISVREDYRPKQGYEPYSVHTFVDKGTLYIRFMHCNLRIVTSIPTKKLTVVLPKDLTFKKITVTTGTANSVVKDISCLDFSQDSGGIGGEIRTENCVYKSFFSNITTGDTIIKDCSFSEKTEFVMGTGSVIMDNSKTALLKGQCRTGDLVLLNCDVKKSNVNVSLTGDCYFTDLVCEDFSVDCTAGHFYVNLSPTMTDYVLDLRSPFDIVYPKDAPTEGNKKIRLHTTAGKIKFMESAAIMELLTPKK